MIAVRRRRSGNDEGGFALVFVLLVTTVIMAAVATTLSTTTPNIVNSRNDQDTAAAMLAAQSGVDDALAYLLSQSACRSTTRVCSQALGANSTTLGRTGITGTNQSFTWTTATSLTPDQYVRVTSTGKAGSVTKKLSADLSLAPSILSFGYYTDYESQSPTILQDYFDGRTIALTDSNTYQQVNAYNNSNGKQISVSSPTTVTWNGAAATTGTNPYPVGICGQHWYRDSTSSPGRYNYGSNSVWGEKGSLNSNGVTRTASCDVVFTTGMTMNGPLYTRDALLISDGTNNGAGPVFKQPAYSLWGFKGYDTPTPPAQPWRQDSSVGGQIRTTGSYQPQIAGLDLQLPTDIGTDGLPSNYCLYTGPTRVKLNGDGTATVTSPYTKTRNAASDAACYPTGSLANGILKYTLNYQTAGSGAVYVKRAGTMPTAGWPENQTRSTNTPAAANEVVYLPLSGGATTPDQPDTQAAPSSSCKDVSDNNQDVFYRNTASWPCAWTGVANATDVGSGTTGGYGWTNNNTNYGCANTNLDASYRQLFECEFAGQASGTAPTSGYGTLRSRVQSDLASGQCLAANLQSGQTKANCLYALMNGELAIANTGDHPYNYATPARGDHRYLAATPSVGTASTGTAQSVGSAPANVMSGDSMFAYTGTPAQETATKTPITMTAYRQTYDCYKTAGSPRPVDASGASCTGSNPSGSYAWGNGSYAGYGAPQFSTTVTDNDWAITSNASGASYFPNTKDVTDYSTGTDSAGAVAGSTGANQPGDLYVEGANSGKLSLIAQDDVVVTGDVTNPENTATTATGDYDASRDAVDIVAGGNVRNYHPVSCVDQTANDVNTTDAGWCPNDITGLYRNILESNGQLSSAHPAMQYSNMISQNPRRIDAAIFALSGSFVTDNYNRGNALGPLSVNGGIYQSHRGANGTQWEYDGSGTRPSSGYSLQYNYVDLERANLPYAPPATGGSNSRVWNVVSISAGS